MLFTTYAFLFAFLPLVLAGSWALRGKDARLAFLTAASWAFYGWWDWHYVPLLAGSTLLNFAAGIAMTRATRPERRKLVLITAICLDVAVLGYFKYANFLLDSLDGLGSAVGVDVGVTRIEVVLPIGISFYTFISISYLIDVHRRTTEATRSFLEFATFVSLFPHLIAGPILRFSDVAERLRRPAQRLTSHDAMTGLFFLGSGLAKKVLIADRLGPTVDELFGAPGDLGVASGWAAAIGYALQLYFDFSGYSDMAVGCAWLLGYRYPQNFDSPYKATSITDFWNRWHMTLSHWLRDYVFFSLARRYATGRRAGRRERLGTYGSLFATMAIAGLWHGAAWTFVVWGAIQGAGLVSERAYRDHRRLSGRRARKPSRLQTVLHRALTFAFVVTAFVVFRSPSLRTAGDVLASMVGLRGVEGAHELSTMIGAQFAAALALILVFVNVAPNTWQVDIAPRRRYGAAVGVMAAIAIMSISEIRSFIYFQF